jgi:hypothetical protein
MLHGACNSVVFEPRDVAHRSGRDHSQEEVGLTKSGGTVTKFVGVGFTLIGNVADRRRLQPHKAHACKLYRTVQRFVSKIRAQVAGIGPARRDFIPRRFWTLLNRCERSMCTALQDRCGRKVEQQSAAGRVHFFVKLPRSYLAVSGLSRPAGGPDGLEVSPFEYIMPDEQQL